MKILKFFTSIFFALLLSVAGALAIAPVIGVKPVYLACAFFFSNFLPGIPGVAGMYLFQAAGGAGATFTQTLQYLPQFLTYDPGANPLTNLKISYGGVVLHDFLAAGIAAMNGYMHVGAMGATEVRLQLASGEMPGTVTMFGTTSAAGAINFYESSDNRTEPVVAFRSAMVTAIALSIAVFDNFTALFIPTMATLTDYADVEFSDGHNKRWEIEDLLSLSTTYQQTRAIIINNITNHIHRVRLRCAANTVVYVLKYHIPGQN